MTCSVRPSTPHQPTPVHPGSYPARLAQTWSMKFTAKPERMASFCVSLQTSQRLRACGTERIALWWSQVRMLLHIACFWYAAAHLHDTSA